MNFNLPWNFYSARCQKEEGEEEREESPTRGSLLLLHLMNMKKHQPVLPPPSSPAESAVPNPPQPAAPTVSTTRFSYAPYSCRTHRTLAVVAPQRSAVAVLPPPQSVLPPRHSVVTPPLSVVTPPLPQWHRGYAQLLRKFQSVRIKPQRSATLRSHTATHRSDSVHTPCRHREKFVTSCNVNKTGGAPRLLIPRVSASDPAMVR